VTRDVTPSGEFSRPKLGFRDERSPFDCVDSRTGLCLGCGRTLDEIAAWSRMSDDERRRIMDALPARMSGERSVAAAE
jgi:hypothetical protein